MQKMGTQTAEDLYAKSIYKCGNDSRKNNNTIMTNTAGLDATLIISNLSK